MRPYVICHMCTTIDGKILSDRWGRLPGGTSGSTLFESTASRFKVSSWLVGTRTMREFSAGKTTRLARATHRIAREDHVGNEDADGYAIGADAKGVLRFKKNDVEGDHVVLLVTRQVSDTYLAHLRAVNVSYLFCGARRLDLGIALEKIRKHLGVRTLMLEGGGNFNGAMLKAGLVDEISQVTVPVVDGGMDVTSIFEISGAATRKAAAPLRVMRRRRLPHGVFWTRYRVLQRK